ncbi:sigma-54-dependent transcriptional regulator [Thermodesulforhabdus norvegica]|uniref:Sigma54 specific transcriptional regulator, Fis family n=1 Tax=Thermodesulforhabdus norvegica TaxID=39841 RepID=A0A1I4QXT2_9BACT|nr:sigma-54 dependent transcriptional regulator [Thermodesulforhabdus norvegica]SFM44839.1 sigma54 specific transcriptional regulator, Fis family [Thermodesulforhabdus norvegica]
MTEQARILVVDDDNSHRLMLSTVLDEWGYEVVEADSGDKAVALVRSEPVDLVIMDIRMPGIDGIEATKLIRQFNPALPVIILTAYGSIPSAVDAVKSGAFDYLTKPVDLDALNAVINKALEHERLKAENEILREQLARFQIADIVGRSPAMERVLELISLIAPTDATVLITGESGTGKSLVARAIHAHSPRKHKPLIEVNCAAIPENLVESELFGHEKGAFTGAEKARAGKFMQANGGTIFLDEIGELNLSVQSKLLHVLQDKKIQRVGSDVAIPIDVRIIAATNRNVEEMLSNGSFRMDLYYRLNVTRIEVPPLRKRPEDIPILAEHFLKRFSEKYEKDVKGFTPEAMHFLMTHSWPGNVRELENAIERAVILSRNPYIDVKELNILGAGLPEPGDVTRSSFEQGNLTLEDVERITILKTLEETGGNKSEAARRLGITRRTLKLKLKKYNAEKKRTP